MSQSDPGNSLGRSLSLGASRHFSSASSSSHVSVILFNLERFFDLFYYHKMDLPGARRQQGAPTEKQSGSEDGTLGPNFSSIITSQVASGKPCHSPGLNDFLCKVQCPLGAGSESNSCVFAGLHSDVLQLSASLHPVAWETVL